MNQTLKLVKNAKLESNGIVQQIRHYDTVIFLYNQDTKKASYTLDYSKTSNRQINYALDFFRPKILNPSKSNPRWQFEGVRN